MDKNGTKKIKMRAHKVLRMNKWHASAALVESFVVMRII